MSDVIFMPVTLIPCVVGNELSQESYRTCGYCGKQVLLDVGMQSLHEKIACGIRFYCSFCLRHELHIDHKDTLSLSFRSLIGYHYKFSHLKTRRLYLSEIKDYIKDHEMVGLANPLFSYDHETYLWAVDFSHVCRIGADSVLKTLSDMLSCFKLQYGADRFYKKYQFAVFKFQYTRNRPKNRRLLIPTLQNCVEESKKFLEETRNFLPQDMKI